MNRPAHLTLTAVLLMLALTACMGEDAADPTPTAPATSAAATATQPPVPAQSTQTTRPASPTPPTGAAENASPTVARTADTSAPTATVAAEPTATVTTEPTAVTGDAEDILLTALLTETDLPEGWSVDKAEIVNPDDPEDEGSQLCDAESYPRKDEKLAEVEGEFSDAEDGVFILQNVVAFPEEVVLDAMNYARTFASCDEWVDDDGTLVTLTHLDDPDLGDDAFTALIRFEAPTQVVEGQWTFVRVGGLIAIVVVVGAEGAELPEYEPLMDAAVARVEAAADELGLRDIDASAALEPLLLTETDLGEGWTVENTGDIEDPERYGLCGMDAFPDRFNALAEVQSDYVVDPENGPLLWHSITALSATAAPEAMDYIRQTGSCGTWEDDGEAYPVTVLDELDLGDESFAALVVIDDPDSEPGHAEVEFVFVRTGNLITVVMYAAVDVIDIAEVERIVRLALDKLEDENS